MRSSITIAASTLISVGALIAFAAFLVHHLFFDGGVLFLGLAIVCLLIALAMNLTPTGSGIARHPYGRERR